MKSFTIPEIAELLRNISAERYDPITPDDGLASDERELVAALNQVFEDRQDIIKRSRSRSRLIIDSTPIAICITNSEGYYEYANPQYRKLTGYDQTELIGRHFSLVVPDELQDELVSLHDEFMGRRYELSGQWMIVSKAGKRIPILANAAYIIDIDNKPKKVTFVIDVTELMDVQKNLEKEIDERHRLEKVRDTVERILRHDLRNPIDGIRTAAELLLEDDLGERPNEFIRLMHEAAGRARDRIDSSLAYTQMEQGSYTIDPKRINVVQLVRDVVREVDDVLSAYRTSIVARYRGAPLDDQFDVELWGEEHYLHDALTHLVRNAVEASQPGETIVVEVDEVADDAAADTRPPGMPLSDTPPSGRKVLISVRNAADIPEEIRDRLFDPYVTHGKQSGTGLGTYTAMLIVTAHGGTVDVETGKGEGTTITMTLPRSVFDR